MVLQYIGDLSNSRVYGEIMEDTYMYARWDADLKTDH